MVWTIIIVLFALAELAYYFILPMAEKSTEIRHESGTKRIKLERQKLELRKEQDELLLWEREKKLQKKKKKKKRSQGKGK